MKLYITELSPYARMVRIVIREKGLGARVEITVWGRELRHRPEDERSPRIIEHERERSRRLADLWESRIDDPLMRGSLNMAQITLVCALLYAFQILEAGWCAGRPKLASWFDGATKWPSVAATLSASTPGELEDRCPRT